MNEILQVKNLTKTYKNGRGISDISFDICKGDIFGFLGPNGSGKTTTMKVITGLCRADSGTVRIFGQDVSTDFEKTMQKVGCIIETVDVYEYMSAYVNLEQAARFYEDVDRARIEYCIKAVGLEKFKDEKVSNFSLGMKQRLGLAAAILSKPELVILDEPVNGLDIEGMVDIRNIIKELAKDHGITFFISSHLIHEIQQTCTKVGIIYEGRLVSTGSMDEILESYPTLEEYFISRVKEERGEVQ